MVVVAYIAPQTKIWSDEEHQQLTTETLDTLKDLLRKMETKSQDIILTGDFNCEVNWETLEAKNHKHNWNENLLNLITDSCLHQHITEPTRHRGTDRPSMLDLIFTRQVEDITDINHGSPLGMSDHDVIDMSYWTEIKKNTKQYKRRHNY